MAYKMVIGYVKYFFGRFGGNLKFNDDWDKKLNEILNDYELIEYSEFTVTLKHNENLYNIWIANYPYASHYLREKNERINKIGRDFRPSIKTCLRFDELVLKPVLEKLKNDKENQIKAIYK